ncbi:hypothetical protein MNBD_CHLOROFLEXI01-415 [hydrothermal vent metagenome]|uniref:DUF5678 domain-containing protein n=1 Tax=hydrothermal vent metagenome TaxID=652676 RepID=A0A3B0W904_9ZZZZ
MVEHIAVSIPQTLYQRVRKVARSRNRSVDDVLLVELLDQALPLDGKLEVDDEETAVSREMRAYLTLHPMLKEKYLGQHVAIFNGKLIDADKEYSALYQRIDERYPDQFVWLATVEEEAIPTLVFRSPRLLPTK